MENYNLGHASYLKDTGNLGEEENCSFIEKSGVLGGTVMGAEK